MKTLATLAVLLLVAASVQAQLIEYNFNDSATSPSATVNNTIGTPSLSLTGSHVSLTGVPGNAYGSSPAGLAAAFTQGVGNDNELLLTFNSTGWTLGDFAFDFMSESTTQIALRIDYRVGLDGSFENVNEFGPSEDGNWHRYTMTLPDQMDNAGDVQLRIRTYQDFGPRSNLAWAMDNVQISAVPEPHEYATMFGAGLIGFAFIRRHWAAVKTRSP